MKTKIELLKEIAGKRPIPKDRIEAALFGYSEDEWQAIIQIANS